MCTAHERTRRGRPLGVLLALDLCACGAGPSAAPPTPATQPSGIGLQVVAQGFSAPLALAAPDDGSGRLFVADQTGVVSVIQPGGTVQPFLDIHDRLIPLNPAYDERGLLGIAFHPDYRRNGRLFVYYSAPRRTGASPDVRHTNHLSEFHVSADANRADLQSESVLLQIDYPSPSDPQVFHQGGQLAFGPEGHLYVGLGDGDDEENGQSLQTLLGKILRIDVDAGLPYGIPPGNPFVGGPGRGEIFAYGFRNPFRFSFDRGFTGALFVGDVGEDLFEEADIVTAGGNYGWDIKEGFHCFNTANHAQPLAACPGTGANGAPLVDPILEYPHTVGRAIIGGFVCRGSALPALAGRYVVGDWSASETGPSGKLFAATPPGGGGTTWSMEELRIATNPGGTLGAVQVLALGEDTRRELYVLTSATPGPTGSAGSVFRIVPPS